MDGYVCEVEIDFLRPQRAYPIHSCAIKVELGSACCYYLWCHVHEGWFGGLLNLSIVSYIIFFAYWTSCCLFYKGYNWISIAYEEDIGIWMKTTDNVWIIKVFNFRCTNNHFLHMRIWYMNRTRWSTTSPYSEHKSIISVSTHPILNH